MSLADNDNVIAIEKDGDRLVEAQNETTKMTLDYSIEQQKLTADAANDRKRMEMEQEKANMDKHMLAYKAVQTAGNCYKNRYIEKTAITNMDQNDTANAVIAGFINKMDAVKAIGH